MKTTFFTLLVCCTLGLSGQNYFVPKEVPSEQLKAEFIKSNYQLNIIRSYFQQNYKASSAKKDIKTVQGDECGFTQQFEPGISYRYDGCAEGKGIFETVTFPKTDVKYLKRWIEQIYESEPMEIHNIWNDSTLEYAPEGREEGCYYTIFQEQNKSIVKIWCGS